VIVGVVILIACSVVVMNIVVDLLYAWLDPRIRVSSAQGQPDACGAQCADVGAAIVEPVACVRIARSAAPSVPDASAVRVDHLVVISALSAFALVCLEWPMDLGSPALQPPSWQHRSAPTVWAGMSLGVALCRTSSLTIGFAPPPWRSDRRHDRRDGRYFRAPSRPCCCASPTCPLPAGDHHRALQRVVDGLELLAAGRRGRVAIWPIEARIVWPVHHPVGTGIRAGGARRGSLDLSHHCEILPNADGHRQVSLDQPAILIEAGLGFLGLSDPTVPSWGEMLNRGQNFSNWRGG
jgi:hypothetical protein